MTEHDIPPERDLPAGRLTALKEDVMAQIQQDIDHDTGTGPPRVIPLGTPRRARRIGLAAAAVAAAAVGLTAVLVAGGDDTASANTAVLTPDGDILIDVNEGRNPEALERRLEDLGVPAVVDFVESGYGCDRSRSDGWVSEPNEALITVTPDMPLGEMLLDPDALRPGETVVFEFQFDEFEGETASNTMIATSMAPVGDCVPVENGSVVDAERGVAGG